MLAAITPKTKAIYLCNPNNPTGTLIDADKLHAFQKNLPEHVLLVVDEAYIDFVEDPDYRTMVDAIADDVNLIVVRTFSKLYGMAGARMGYLMANQKSWTISSGIPRASAAAAWDCSGRRPPWTTWNSRTRTRKGVKESRTSWSAA